MNYALLAAAFLTAFLLLGLLGISVWKNYRKMDQAYAAIAFVLIVVSEILFFFLTVLTALIAFTR